MIKAALPAALAVSIAFPLADANAQAAAPASENLIVVRPAHLVAIGVGVLGGIVVGEALFATDLGVVVGGVLGGYMAHVWYGGRQLELNLGTVTKP
jgi:hypothetical protein